MPDQPLERPARIDTARLILVVLLPSEIRALMAGDSGRASNEAGVRFPSGWPESDEAREGLPWHLGHLESNERHRAWRIRVIVDRETNVVVGSVNLKGPPDAEGNVEIGWGITEAWRRRGYALEAVSGVIAWALHQPGTESLTATIADDNVASQRLAAKLGFVRTARLRRGKPVWSRTMTMRTDVETLMKAWQDAWFAKDGRAIAGMMTEDYAYVAPNGAVMDRTAIAAVVDDPTYALTAGAHTETVVATLGEAAAIVRRRWQGSGTYQGQEFVEDHRCVTICDRSSGQWRIRYEQCSAVGVT